MPHYNLLVEPLIGVAYETGVREKLTLPGVLAKLSRDDIESFTALQPHQEQAWYCFLVQLAAMAMHECGTGTIEADETEWARRLRSLTKEFPGDEPWCMVVGFPRSRGDRPIVEAHYQLGTLPS
jgi:CRISPR system Cascade subunit CasA